MVKDKPYSNKRRNVKSVLYGAKNIYLGLRMMQICIGVIFFISKNYIKGDM